MYSLGLKPISIESDNLVWGPQIYGLKALGGGSGGEGVRNGGGVGLMPRF